MSAVRELDRARTFEELILDQLEKLNHRLNALAGEVESSSRVARLEPWLTKDEFAQHMRVSARRVEEWEAAGMPHRVLGSGSTSRHAFRVSVCEPWLRSRGKIKENP